MAQHLEVPGTDQANDRPKTHPFEAGSIYQITNCCDDGSIGQRIQNNRIGEVIWTTDRVKQLRIVQLDRAYILFSEQAEIVQKALGNGLLFDTRKLTLISMANPARRANGVTDDGAINPCDDEVDEVVKILAMLIIPGELHLFDEVERCRSIAEQQRCVGLKMAFSAKAHAFVFTKDEATGEMLG